MPILGIDDTDSSSEMCTTYVTMEILKNTSLDLIGFPRLVRLNPNIPLKTRGNAAISLKLGRGHGTKRLIGLIRDEPIYSYDKGDEEELDVDIPGIIEKLSPNEEKTNPAFVQSNEPLNYQIYWRAVREFVDYKGVLLALKNKKFWTKNGEIGLVGAAAAISWKQELSTYELISYLPKERWNGGHMVDGESAKFIEQNFFTTFDSFDLMNNYNAIRPTTKTPVLFGIRGIDVNDLLEALSHIKSEPYESFIIYITNQGTDDHIVERTIAETSLYHSSKLNVTVTENPVSLRGGIVKVRVGDKTGEMDAVAMEPTKGFRNVIRSLRIGDRIQVYGGVTKPGIINIEKIKILSLSKEIIMEPPVCAKCGKKMESTGRNGIYRCRRCGTTGVPQKKIINRDLNTGYYEVPIIARRHLARPLKLGVVV